LWRFILATWRCRKEPEPQLDTMKRTFGVTSEIDGSRKWKSEKAKKFEEPKRVLNRHRAIGFPYLARHPIRRRGHGADYIKHKTWFYGIDGTWFPALQFVAKAHEILMQISTGMAMVVYL
jgi:hypothetical protein